ncbi:MAG: TetR/AcrR family transcriptional regulator [Clostridia bacterium]|nr:TetR/AcrR family transcriptional regulator [Clostridia bacterium]
MPPAIKTDRKAIINAVMEIIDESGWSAVSARSVAERLGISTQPIYREFADMDEVRRAAIERGFEIFTEYIADGALGQAVKYVEFAAEKGNLFNFLFRGKHYEYTGLDDLSRKLVSEDIIDRLEEITKLPREKVYRVHLCVWMALHGLAAISADNRVAVSGEEIALLAKEMTQGLTALYKTEGAK